MSHLLRADDLLRYHICEWKNGQYDSVYIITLFMWKLILNDCYEDCMIVDIYYCGGYVALFDQVLVCYLVW
jgi:hypothetical protein